MVRAAVKVAFAAVLALACVSAHASIAYVSASGTNCSQNTASAGVACTLTASTTNHNMVIVGLSWKTNTRSIENIKGSAAGSYAFTYAQGCNGTGSCSAVAICVNCPAITTVTPTFTGTTLYELNVAEYSGVTWVGFTSPITTGTSTAPAVTITTSDANDWMVMEESSLGNAGIPTSNTGNLRQANRTGTTSSNVAGALCDNTVASAGSLKCQVTITSGAWSAIAVELRTTAPKTYIYPDCDLTHPCLIHEKTSPALSVNTDTLTSPLKFAVPPFLANNLHRLVISMSDAVTPGTPTDDGSNTWSAGSSTDDTSNHVITKTWYVCAGATNTANINIPWTGTLSASTVFQVTYQEVSGIATSSCRDGGSGANGIQGTIQPGSITTTANGDFIFTQAVNASTSTQNSTWMGQIMPDDNAALIESQVFNQWASEVELQASLGAINTTLYANAQDPNNSGGVWFNIVDDAFKASSGAGTQPTGIWVVTDQQIFNGTGTGAIAWNPIPNGGNALVLSTSNPSSGAGSNITNLTDNGRNTYTRTCIAGTNCPAVTTDPQQYYSCLGSNAVNKDLIYSFTPDTSADHIEVYTIANARSSGVSSGVGCQGASTIQGSGNNQNATTNSNIVGDPVFTPTINSGATSVVIATSYIGTGPPSGLCISGGVTPPSCTGQSSGVIFNSFWASGMTDSSAFSTGDPFAFYYTSSATSKSLDYLMANGVGSTAYDGAALEIEGQASGSSAKCSLALLGAGPC